MSPRFHARQLRGRDARRSYRQSRVLRTWEQRPVPAVGSQTIDYALITRLKIIPWLCGPAPSTYPFSSSGSECVRLSWSSLSNH